MLGDSPTNIGRNRRCAHTERRVFVSSDTISGLAALGTYRVLWLVSHAEYRPRRLHPMVGRCTICATPKFRLNRLKRARKKRPSIKGLSDQINAKVEQLEKVRGRPCYPLLLGDQNIGRGLVDKVYGDLRSQEEPSAQLDVLVDSGGGDIDAAYNLALLFRRYGTDQLTFIVPRWAKSAATLLICGGDEILMTPVAELGPLDPQITQMNPLEQRVERFSPLHIESTLQLIRDEFTKGNTQLAEGLMQRLQFPLTLGSFKKSLDIGREYVEKLLASRMLKGDDAAVKGVGEAITSGYADHSWCITIGEAGELGLKASELTADALEVVWDIHTLDSERQRLVNERTRKRIEDQIKDLPKDVVGGQSKEDGRTEATSPLN